jgi:hypothetical protein
MKPVIRHLDTITQGDAKLGQALSDIQSAIGNVSAATGTSPSGGQIAAPPPIVGMTVTAAGGVHHISLTDGSSPLQRGIEYHLEASPTPDFQSPVGISLGPHRSYRGSLGGGPLFFRAYSAYPGTTPPPGRVRESLPPVWDQVLTGE